MKSPINALPRAERSRMLDLARQAQPTPLAVAIEIMLTTGMRRGEVCALRWEDFDVEKRTLTVSHSLGNGEGGFYLKEPKSGKVRTIPLTEHTHSLLLSMRTEVEWVCKRMKFPFTNYYILGSVEENSRPYNPTKLTRDFSAFCKMNGFSCTVHDLRHTFATFMIAEGADIVTVANYLGHAKASMTLDIYADVDPEAKANAIKYIDSAFDDAMSVFQRNSEKRRREIEEEEREKELQSATEGNGHNIPPNAIPFTMEELESMLSTLKNTN